MQFCAGGWFADKDTFSWTCLRWRPFFSPFSELAGWIGRICNEPSLSFCRCRGRGGMGSLFPLWLSSLPWWSSACFPLWLASFPVGCLTRLVIKPEACSTWQTTGGGKEKSNRSQSTLYIYPHRFQTCKSRTYAWPLSCFHSASG